MSVPIDSGASKAASAAAEPPPEPPGIRASVPRVAGGPVRRVLGGRAHGELVHVRLAQDRDPGGPKPRRHGGVVRRPPALEDLRPAGGGHVDRGEDVLECQRDAGQRRRGRGAGVERRVHQGRRLQRRASAATCRKACTVPSTAAIRSRCACATSTADTSREWIFSASSAAVRRVRSITPPPPGSAARGSARPRRRARRPAPAPASGRGGARPARNTFSSGTACEVGGISSAATSPTRATAPRMTSS